MNAFLLTLIVWGGIIFPSVTLHAQERIFWNLDPDTLINQALSLNYFDKQTEIEEIKNVYKLSLWHFAPSLSYDFIRNRYYVSLSTAGLVSHFVSKKQENRRMGAIERRYKAKNIADELKVNNLVLAIEADFQDILLNRKATSIEIELFLIKKQQYAENEIDTETYLTAKSHIINRIKLHNSSVTELFKNILNLSGICNVPIPADDTKQLYFTLEFLDN